MDKATIRQKKEYAELLYLREQMTQKEIAQKVEVSEKTLCKWVAEGEWEQRRTAGIISRQEFVDRNYAMLKALQDQIANQGNIPLPAQADTISKLAASIRALETETGIAETIDVFKEYLGWLKPQDLTKAKEQTLYFDSYIKHKLKKM